MILIVGAAGPLGVAIARTLMREGHACALHARTTEQLKEFDGVKKIPGDLTHPDDFIRRCAEEDIRGLVFTVGPYIENPPSHMSRALQQMLPLNLLLPVQLTEALLPSLECVVHIGSTNLQVPWQKASAYGLAKQALLTYTRALAKELEGKTRVNMVSPGHLPHSVTKPTHPVSCEEIAETIAHLFSEKGKQVTGQNIELD